ncbi:hypothetical protein FQA39_LY01197 [Lamprigera yunnana]|nr:hypothetical protein FQA39_LY01197 [Lamprigera yunnana]
MVEKQNECDIEQLYRWIDDYPLTRTKKNISRDFSDAVPLAEILKHHYPKLVDLHNYTPTNSVRQKLINWQTLNRKVLNKIDITIPQLTMEQLANSEAGTIEKVLFKVKDKILTKPQEKSSDLCFLEGLSSNLSGSVISIKQKDSSKTLDHKVIPVDTFLKMELDLNEKDQTINNLSDKVQHMEALLIIKDERINDLTRQIQQISRNSSLGVKGSSNFLTKLFEEVNAKLRNNIIELKRELSLLRNINQYHRVKMRKLQNEVDRKDKQIKTLLDPQKSHLTKKAILDRGVSVDINLKNRIRQLEKLIFEKDGKIKKLKNDLKTVKVYNIQANRRKPEIIPKITFYDDVDRGDFEGGIRALPFSYKWNSMHDIIEQSDEQIIKHIGSRSRSVSAERIVSPGSNYCSNVKAQYESLPKSHLLSIIECLKNNQLPQRNKKNSEITLQFQSSHQEIVQLQSYFMDILEEVDCLKNTISSIKREQEKMIVQLREKNYTIQHLAQEIEFLKDPLVKSKISVLTVVQEDEEKECKRSSSMCILSLKNYPKINEENEYSNSDKQVQECDAECLKNPSSDKRSTKEMCLTDTEGEIRKEKFQNLLIKLAL